MGSRASTVRGRLFTRGRLTLLGTVLVLAVGGVIAARTIETDRVIEAVRVADPAVLVLAVGVYLLSWPLRGHRYDDILGVMGRRCGFRFLTGAVFVSQLANLVLPARAGDGVRAYLLNSRRTVPYATGAASLTVERLFDLLALAAFGVVALASLLLSGRTLTAAQSGTFLQGAAFVASVAVVLMGATVLVARRGWDLGEWLRNRTDHSLLGRIVEMVVSFGADVRVVAADPRALTRVGVGSLAIWALDALTAILVIRAVVGGSALSVPTLLAVGTLAVTVGNLAKVLPLSQGGIGLYEAAFTAVVVAVSPVSAATALAAAILDHAVKNGVTLAGGAVAALALNISPTPVETETDLGESESPDF